jgi:hypothetical protein
VADLNTRGTIYDDGLQDRSVQMAADTGRRSQAELGSQQQGFASSGSMGQSGGMGASSGMGMGSDRMGSRGMGSDMARAAWAIGTRTITRTAP